MFLTGYSVINKDCTHWSSHECVSTVKEGQKVYTSEVDQSSRTITYFTCKNDKNKQDKYCVASSGGI